MKPSASLFLLGVALAFSGCTPSPAAAPAPSPESPSARESSRESRSTSRRRSHSHVLTGEEIRESQALNAYEAVANLRPRWLRNRGGRIPDADGSVEVQVWYNGRQLGTPEVLRSIEITHVISMEYVSSIEARTRYGSGNGRGVIAVTGR